MREYSKAARAAVGSTGVSALRVRGLVYASVFLLYTPCRTQRSVDGVLSDGDRRRNSSVSFPN